MLGNLTISDGYRPLVNGILVPTYEKFATRAVRERFGLRKFQRGILQLAAGGTMVPAGGDTIPLVTDIEIIDSVASGIVNAVIVFNEPTVGSVTSLVKRHSALHLVMGDDDQTVPVDHTGEWTSDSVVASAWEVACTSEDSGTWDFPFASVGVYSDFTNSDMEWRENRPGGKAYTPGTDTCTGTFRIREVADTANFTEFEVICTAIQT